MANCYNGMNEEELLSVAVGHIVGNTDIPKALMSKLKRYKLDKYLPEESMLEKARADRAGTPAKRKVNRRKTGAAQNRGSCKF